MSKKELMREYVLSGICFVVGMALLVVVLAITVGK